MLLKIIRRFDTSDEHAKDMRGYVANILQKVKAHAIFIKNLEIQMSQLSTTVYPRKPGCLLSCTIHNRKNDGHCMTITTRRGKQTIDPPMPSVVEVNIGKEKRGSRDY